MEQLRVGMIEVHGAGFGVEVVVEFVAEGVDAAAGAWAGFEDDDVVAGLLEFVGCCESGEAGADDYDLFRRGGTGERESFGLERSGDDARCRKNGGGRERAVQKSAAAEGVGHVSSCAGRRIYPKRAGG